MNSHPEAIQPGAAPLPNMLLSPLTVNLTDKQIRAFCLVFAGLVIFLYTTLRLFLRSSDLTADGGAARTVLIVGPMGAGKTRVWGRLVFGKESETVTSLTENRGLVARKGEAGKAAEALGESAAELSPPLVFLDTPGHPRLRNRSLASALPSARGVIFALDSSSMLSGRGLREAGEHLHLLLSQLGLLAAAPRRQRAPRAAPGPPLLILLTSPPPGAGAGDRPLHAAATLDRARAALSRELARRRSPAAAPSASFAPAPAAALEGLEPVPLGRDGGGGGRWSLAALFERGAGGGDAPPDGKRPAVSLPQDEGEVASRIQEQGDAIGLEGDAAWEGGVRWAVRGPQTEAMGGLAEVWDWAEGL